VFFFGELRDNVFVSCRANPDQPGVERRIPQQLVANRPVQNAVEPPEVNKKVQSRGLVVKAEDCDQEVLCSGQKLKKIEVGSESSRASILIPAEF
jgi:hypothetical protein